MNASNYLENNIINYFLRGQTVTQPTTVYLALYINDPTDLNTGTEITGGNYERVAVTFTPPSQNEGHAKTSNALDLEFNKAGKNWGTITHWGILDKASGGNLLVRGSFNRPEEIKEGNKFVIEQGNLSIGVD